MRGREIESPVPLLRLLAVADAMEFKHLPVMGGIYDQHPEFVEGMMGLLSERSKWEREKQKREEDKQKHNGRMPSHPRRSR